MKLVDLHSLAKHMVDVLGDISPDVTIHLNESKLENLQQEIYKMQNDTLRGYVSKDNFAVVIYGVSFHLKKKR
jgi:hypothetical protein